jgi:hypothetical protein
MFYIWQISFTYITSWINVCNTNTKRLKIGIQETAELTYLILLIKFWAISCVTQMSINAEEQIDL